MGKSKSAAARKSEKVRLTKQQKIQVGRMIRLENRISVCREYIQLWSRFFQFFAEDLRERPIKPEEEKAFFQALTLLAHKHFLFNELMGDTFSGGEKILDVLVRATSLNAIKQMDEGSLSKFELEWHSLFLDMNVALGRLLRLMPAGMKINEMLAHAEAVAKGGKAPDAKKAKKAKKGAEVEQGA